MTLNRQDIINSMQRPQYYGICKPVRIGTSKLECDKRQELRTASKQADTAISQAQAQLLSMVSQGGQGDKLPIAAIALIALGGLVIIGTIIVVVKKMKK